MDGKVKVRSAPRNLIFYLCGVCGSCCWWENESSVRCVGRSIIFNIESETEMALKEAKKLWKVWKTIVNFPCQSRPKHRTCACHSLASCGGYWRHWEWNFRLERLSREFSTMLLHSGCWWKFNFFLPFFYIDNWARILKFFRGLGDFSCAQNLIERFFDVKIELKMKYFQIARPIVSFKANDTLEFSNLFPILDHSNQCFSSFFLLSVSISKRPNFWWMRAKENQTIFISNSRSHPLFCASSASLQPISSLLQVILRHFPSNFSKLSLLKFESPHNRKQNHQTTWRIQNKLKSKQLKWKVVAFVRAPSARMFELLIGRPPLMSSAE